MPTEFKKVSNTKYDNPKLTKEHRFMYFELTHLELIKNFSVFDETYTLVKEDKCEAEWFLGLAKLDNKDSLHIIVDNDSKYFTPELRN